MGRLPADIEDLARKVAQAFATAFAEQSTMVTSPTKSQLPKTQTAKAPTGRPTCPHERSEFLATRLPVPSQCPTCIIFEPINDIREVQQEFVDRGGAFSSKEKGEHHKTLKSNWKRAKISLMRIVTLYESLMNDPQVPANDKAKVRLALDVYEKRKVALARVPGLEYVEGAEEEQPTEEDTKIAGLMVELLKKVLDEEMQTEDKEYAAKWPAIATTEEPLKPWWKLTAKENLAITMHRPQTPSERPSISQPAPSPLTPRSILKRQQSLSSSPSMDGKRICIAETVTVSPAHLNVRDPSKLMLEPTEPTTQPHSKHATGEHKRARVQFWRPGAAYRPGPWASQACEEKANTSNMKVDWNELMKLEQTEAARESVVTEKMRNIAKIWAEKRATRNVIQSQNLEEWDKRFGKS
ncbi:hypothetical protein FB567DRAFT_497126 [Paraphoma chrysanthemicola]|uniref:Uncharacterized protein n=1 Tax=Paraphoma chrysanthemicola TaxID=798071 RepID=A0A8K0VYA2_9PLEO|nr:hypothetical protein FB567DRAFT_497126 [Paraphoma chrysanthemicola]